MRRDSLKKSGSNLYSNGSTTPVKKVDWRLAGPEMPKEVFNVIESWEK